MHPDGCDRKNENYSEESHFPFENRDRMFYNRPKPSPGSGPEMKGEFPMHKPFGTLPTGVCASLYTISRDGLTAAVTDYGATLVRLLVPDAQGERADVVLGYDDVTGYQNGTVFLGATVGRNANRIRRGTFVLNGRTVTIPANEGANNLHSGPDYYHNRLWTVEAHTETAITLSLHSPHGDQGFPGNADIRVTYALEAPATLRITYDALCDRDTVFNLTNHSYFNLAGHDHPELAMGQELTLNTDFFTPADEESIPTGELRPVVGTPMDFRVSKAIGQDIGADYEPLHLQGGYDHNFAVDANPCAILRDPVSGRRMALSTDCPGLQFYSGNFLTGTGKDGISYGKRSAIALEPQFFPDAVNQPQWQQPITPANTPYHSETTYCFG